MGRARTDRSLGVVVGGLMSLTSTMVVALPALASAAPVTQTFDIWNLTSTALNVIGYDKAGTYRMLPPESLPTAKVLPMGKNLQLIVPAGYGVITKLAGSQQAQQGGTQTWEVHTNLETLDSFPAPVPHMACVPGDTRNAACGVTSGNNVQALADGPGTAITVPNSDTQRQAEVKAAFCDHPYRTTLQIKCSDFAWRQECRRWKHDLDVDKR